GTSISPYQANYDGTRLYKGGGMKGEFRQKTVPVKSFEPNPWGLYQVHGNVWEWVQDCGNAAGGFRGFRRHLLRGGSWEDNPWRVRSASRTDFDGAYRDEHCGFRIARML